MYLNMSYIKIIEIWAVFVQIEPFLTTSQNVKQNYIWRKMLHFWAPNIILYHFIYKKQNKNILSI
jgi:hypothetical protein